VQRNGELNNKIGQLENSLKNKENQIDDQRRENENLKNAHAKEIDHNYHM